MYEFVIHVESIKYAAYNCLHFLVGRYQMHDGTTLRPRYSAHLKIILIIQKKATLLIGILSYFIHHWVILIV